MSDDQQRKASIEDQFRNCDEGADEKGFNPLQEHTYTGSCMYRHAGTGSTAIESTAVLDVAGNVCSCCSKPNR
jgi:hypothetical protein